MHLLPVPTQPEPKYLLVPTDYRYGIYRLLLSQLVCYAFPLNGTQVLVGSSGVALRPVIGNKGVAVCSLALLYRVHRKCVRMYKTGIFLSATTFSLPVQALKDKIKMSNSRTSLYAKIYFGGHRNLSIVV